MKKSFIFTLFVLFFFNPLLGISQLSDTETFIEFLSERNHTHLFGSSFIHVTNNNKYIITDNEDFEEFYIFTLNEETGMPVDLYKLDWKGETDINNHHIVSDIAITSDDSLMVISGDTVVTIFSFDSQNGSCEPISSFNLPQGYSCESITISNDDDFLFVLANDSIFSYSLNTPNGQAVLKASQHLNLITKACINTSSFNNRLLINDPTGTRIYVYLWDKNTYEFIQESMIQLAPFNSFQFREKHTIKTDLKGNLYVRSAIDSSLIVYSFSEAEKQYKLKYRFSNFPLFTDITIHPHDDVVFALESMDTDSECSISIFCWDNNELSLLKKVKLTGDGLGLTVSMTISPNGKFMYQGQLNNSMIVKHTLGFISKNPLSIRGSVIGATSEVVLYKKEAESFTEIRKVTTNEKNEFEFDLLHKGEYIVKAVPGESSPFLPTYYNQTTNINNAEIINLQGNVSSVDITLVEKETATAELTNANLFTVYPNPLLTDEGINIKTQTEGEIIIRNAQTQTIFSEKICGNYTISRC